MQTESERMNMAAFLGMAAGRAVGLGPIAPTTSFKGKSEVITRVKEEEVTPEGALPEVHEDAATICVGSDRYPATIVERPNAKTVVVQRDNYRRKDNRGPHTESQDYWYFENDNPEAITETFTLRQNDRWIRKGEKMRGGTPLAIGSRNAYSDPHF